LVLVDHRPRPPVMAGLDPANYPRNEAHLWNVTRSIRGRWPGRSPAMTTSFDTSALRLVHPPQHAIRIAELPVPVAPEHVGHRHHHFRAGVDRALPRGVDIVH